VAGLLPQENLPLLPEDSEGPVFREPWEAQAFAITLRLHEQGVFAWSELVEALAAEIARGEHDKPTDPAMTYYHHWLAALESLLAHKLVVDPAQLAARKAEIAANPPDHDHVARRGPVKVDPPGA
jgi:nitrile hydratase accessory protein